MVGSDQFKLPSGFVYTVRGKPSTQASVMLDAPPPTKLPGQLQTAVLAARNFKPVDLSLLGSVGVGSSELDHLAPWLQSPFPGSEQFCLTGVPGVTGV